MKKLLFFISLSATFSAQTQQLDGAFKITEAQYGSKLLSKEEIAKEQMIKIFKDGYWISTIFGYPKNPFSGSGGGTYSTDGNKYSETLRFYSWDSTAVGDTYAFNYQLSGDNYFQEGKMDSEKYHNYLIKEAYSRIKCDMPLKNASLEGVWSLQSASWSNKENGSLKDIVQIKIYSYPRFAWAQYNDKTKQFMGAGGGTYQYDGKNLIEHIEYITYGLALGTDFKIDVKKLSDGTILQTSEMYGSAETWKRLK